MAIQKYLRRRTRDPPPLAPRSPLLSSHVQLTPHQVDPSLHPPNPGLHLRPLVRPQRTPPPGARRTLSGSPNPHFFFRPLTPPPLGRARESSPQPPRPLLNVEGAPKHLLVAARQPFLRNTSTAHAPVRRVGFFSQQRTLTFHHPSPHAWCAWRGGEGRERRLLCALFRASSFSR